MTLLSTRIILKGKIKVHSQKQNNSSTFCRDKMRFVLEPREDLQYVCQSVTVVVASIHSFTFKIAGLLATRASSLTSATCLRRSPLQAGHKPFCMNFCSFVGRFSCSDVTTQNTLNTFHSQPFFFVCLFVCLFLGRKVLFGLMIKKIQQN